MSGPPLTLNIDPTATPKPCHTPIPIPIHWQDEVKASLDRDVRLGVLEQVPLGTPDTWCHRMVICTKKNGSLRRTIDFQQLNRHATRETHHTQSPFHQARAVPMHTKKTIFDAWNGYHSVALAESDRHYTTFITPWGRYRYCSAPQGYIASGDAYTARYDSLVSEVNNKTKCIDDALLWSTSIEDAFHQATEWLDICARNSQYPTPSLLQSVARHVGHSLSNMRTPSLILDVISSLDASNACWRSSVHMNWAEGFRRARNGAMTGAMEKANATWLTSPNQALMSVIPLGVGKSVMARRYLLHGLTSVLVIWNPASSCAKRNLSGFKVIPFQKHCQCPSQEIFCCQDGWKVTLVGSRFTHAAESRYAPIEGEALAVADALDKARHFVLGCSNLVVAVDHKPLCKLFGDRSLEPNTRLRNLKEKTLRYRFSMVHIPGIRNKTSDALSRHPTGATNPAKMPLQDDVTAPTVDCPRSSPKIPSSLLAGISIAPQSEEDYKGLSTAMCAAVSNTPLG